MHSLGLIPRPLGRLSISCATVLLSFSQKRFKYPVACGGDSLLFLALSPVAYFSSEDVLIRLEEK